MNSKNYKIYIQLFYEFSVTYHDANIQMDQYLSKQTLSLLEVLILNYGKSVSKETLTDILWENNDNPDSALKFNIFRLRKLLKTIPQLSELDLIQTDKNGYRFDPGVDWECDVHEFEKVNEQIVKKRQQGMEHFQKVKELLRLYKGNLYHADSYLWFVQKEEHYRNIYSRNIPPICEYYIKEKCYEEVHDISLKAMSLEPSIESNYYYHILAYIKEKDYTQAQEHYRKATEILMNDYEMELSMRMQALYHDMINSNDQRKKPEDIMQEYKTKNFSKGAFYCTNAVFDYVFEHCQRTAKRSRISYFLYVFEIQMTSLEPIEESMQKLKISITNTLRSGDVFSKLNNSQYIALLPCPTEEYAYTIAQRVGNVYRTKSRKISNRLNYHVQKIST